MERIKARHEGNKTISGTLIVGSCICPPLILNEISESWKDLRACRERRGKYCDCQSVNIGKDMTPLLVMNEVMKVATCR